MEKAYFALLNRLRRTILRDPPSLTEFTMLALDWVWAYVLLWGDPHLFDESASYMGIGDIGVPQWVLGAAFALVGGFKAVGWASERIPLSAVGAVPAVGLWSIISLGFAQAPHPHPTEVGVYAVCAVVSGIIGLHAVATMRDRRALEAALASGSSESGGSGRSLEGRG